MFEPIDLPAVKMFFETLELYPTDIERLEKSSNAALMCLLVRLQATPEDKAAYIVLIRIHYQMALIWLAQDHKTAFEGCVMHLQLTIKRLNEAKFRLPEDSDIELHGRCIRKAIHTGSFDALPNNIVCDQEVPNITITEITIPFIVDKLSTVFVKEDFIQRAEIQDKMFSPCISIKRAEQVGSGSFSNIFSAVLSSRGESAVVEKQIKFNTLRNMRVNYQTLANEIHYSSQSTGHPNIPTMVGVTSFGSLVSEKWSMSLDVYIGKDHTFSFISLMLDDLLCAVEWLHRRGWTHTDIKLGNILIDEDSGHAVLADAGSTCDEEYKLNIADGHALAFMPPEVLKDYFQLYLDAKIPAALKLSHLIELARDKLKMAEDTKIDWKKVDIYSVGMVGFQCYHLYLPYSENSNRLYFMTRILEFGVPLDNESRDIHPIVWQCLQYLPGDRPDATQVLQALRADRRKNDHIKQRYITKFFNILLRMLFTQEELIEMPFEVCLDEHKRWLVVFNGKDKFMRAIFQSVLQEFDIFDRCVISADAQLTLIISSLASEIHGSSDIHGLLTLIHIQYLKYHFEYLDILANVEWVNQLNEWIPMLQLSVSNEEDQIARVIERLTQSRPVLKTRMQVTKSEDGREARLVFPSGAWVNRKHAGINDAFSEFTSVAKNPASYFHSSSSSAITPIATTRSAAPGCS